MIELQKEFKAHKNLYRQIENEGGVYVYAVHNYEAEQPSYFEIFKRKEIGEKEIFGRLQPAHVKYPSDNDFGVWAWCCSDMEQLEKIKAMILQ